MNGKLYKRGFSLSYLKCLNPKEETYVLRESHEGICDNHSGPRSLVGKVIRVGYFWPTMQKDAVELVKKSDKCQWFENVQHIPGELMMSISSPWPFSTWGINIIGPLPQGKKQVKFLPVPIDYFTKWVEVEPLAIITKSKIQNFVWKNIVCRFGIPRMIISDNGRQFDSRNFREFCGNKKPLLVTWPSISEWSDRGNKFYFVQTHQSMICRGKGCMTKRVTKGTMGLSNNCKSTNRRKTTQAGLQYGGSYSY